MVLFISLGIHYLITVLFQRYSLNHITANSAIINVLLLSFHFFLIRANHRSILADGTQQLVVATVEGVSCARAITTFSTLLYELFCVATDL